MKADIFSSNILSFRYVRGGMHPLAGGTLAAYVNNRHAPGEPIEVLASICDPVPIYSRTSKLHTNVGNS